MNAIAPGYSPSELTSGRFEDERSFDWVKHNTPMGRAGEEHELDGALLYLASEVVLLARA